MTVTSLISLALLAGSGAALKLQRGLSDDAMDLGQLFAQWQGQKPGSKVVVDIGAGYHPLQPDDTTCVVMVEPQQKAVEALNKKYGGDSRVCIIHAAISDHNGTQNLTHYILEGRMSSLDTPNGWGKGSSDAEVVNVTTLDTILRAIPLEKFGGAIDLLQIDAQGEDYRIVKSAGALIKKVKEIKAEVYKDGFLTYFTNNSKGHDWAPLMKNKGFVEEGCEKGLTKNTYGYHAAELRCTYRNKLFK